MGNIRSVSPLGNYQLLLELNTGSSIKVDLSAKLKTARFAELADPAVFYNVKADGEMIVWGEGVLKISMFELIDVAVGGR